MVHFRFGVFVGLLTYIAIRLTEIASAVSALALK